MPAAVAPPPITPLSTMATVKPAREASSAQAAPTMPAPMIVRSNVCELIGASSANAKTERIGGVDDQLSIGGDESGSLYGWVNLIIPDGYRAFKEAANDALLAPDLSFAKLTLSLET